MARRSEPLGNYDSEHEKYKFCGNRRQSAVMTNDVTQATAIKTVTGETTTIGAGAAGTTGTLMLDYAPVSDANGENVGSVDSTSFAFVTGTILDNEVEYDYETTDAVQLTAMSNGDYAINYVTGKILYKKKTADTAETANYKYRTQEVNVSGGAGGVDVDDSAFTVATDKGQVVMGYAGTDSVDADDKGALAMTTDRRLRVRDDAYDSGTTSNKTFEVSPVNERYTSAQTITGPPQDFTANWADLGGEINCSGYNTLRLFLTLDINDSENCRVRALVKHESAGAEEYNLPILTTAASDVKVESHYYEFNVDADSLFCLEWDVAGIPYVQFQISAGTVGATEGQIDAAKYTLSWR